MKFYTYLLFIFFCFALVEGNAQKNRKNKLSKKEVEEEYFDENALVYDNHVYQDYIKTPTLYLKGAPITDNIITLGEGASFVLGFDDLEGDLKDYNFSFFHCNNNWEPTDILETDFLESFYDNYIQSAEYGFNTKQHYTHYEIEFPNEEIQFNISGNYVVLVYEDNDIEKPILSKRFMITEQSINISPTIKPASKVDDRNYRQEIDFSISSGVLNIQNPYSNLNVVIQQNGRVDNLVRDLKPVFVKENEIVYDFDEVNNFDGNNEYRFFDFKNLRYQTVNIAQYKKNDTANFVYLLLDPTKTYKNHYSVQELNGKYMIDFENGNDPDTDADYAWVIFTLDYPKPIENGDLYVFGGFTDWKFREDCKLHYLEEIKKYQCAVYLKQGYYNYHYALLKDNQTEADVSFIEGTHYATENDYTIYVYYKEPTERFERLVGVSKINSVNH